ncbi:hypothetical protein RJT34_22584 [Clitoria ternatea]|uniref:Uncharacterized protein n=1 Tax=Clitoria ternatea TaxID=43366 RepID=A0AAN9IGF3_CLITE
MQNRELVNLFHPLKELLGRRDPTFVNQTLLISRDIAVVNDDILEGYDGGIEPNLNRKLGTIGAANVDADSIGSGGVRLCRGTLGSNVTSYGVVRPKHKKGIKPCTA